MITNGIDTLLARILLELILLLATVVRVFPLVFSAILIFKYTRNVSIVPGVPKLDGLSFLGFVLLSVRHGTSEVVDRLLRIATDGISYACVANNVLIFVHDTTMIRQLLAMPEEFVSRSEASPETT